MARKWRMQPKADKAKVAERKLREAKTKDLPPYVMPHKYLPLVRGVPMRDHTKPSTPAATLPPMVLPIEAQNSLAYHLEMVGLVHVSDLEKMANDDGMVNINDLPPVYLKHLKPVEGPDIQLNPGTWVPASSVTTKEVKNDEVSVLVEDVELPFDPATASPDELAALEAAVHAVRIQRTRELNVDYDAKVAENVSDPVVEQINEGEALE